MAWDGNGNITRTNGTNSGNSVWQDDRDDGVNIRADRHDTHDEDLANAIENTVALDGQNTTTTDNALLRYSTGTNNKFVGVAIGTNELVGRQAGDIAGIGIGTNELAGRAVGNITGIAVGEGETVAREPGGNLGGVRTGILGKPASLSTMQALDTSAFSDGDVIYLRGRTSVGDGGEGHFRWDSSDRSTEVAADEVTASEGNGGIYIAPASDKTGASGVWVRQNAQGTVDVRWYGAKCDGTTDDTVAWAAAVTALGANGGEVRFPAGTRSKGNITITANNIKFKAFSFSRGLINTQLVPAVLTDPVISVGDGVTLCKGFQADGIIVEGLGSSGAIGLKINGAAVCTYRNFSAQGFSDAGVRITSSSTQPTTYQFFDGFDISAAASASAIGLDVDYGPQYASALYFSNGTIGGQSASLWALQINKSHVNLANVWLQVSDGRGINLKSTGGTIGSISASNVTVDSDSSTDVLLQVDFASTASARAVQEVLSGSISVDGYLGFSDSVSIKIAGTHWIGSKSNHLYPRVFGSIGFQDASGGPIEQDGSNLDSSLPRILFDKTNSRLTIQPQSGNYLNVPLGSGASIVRLQENASSPWLYLYKSGYYAGISNDGSNMRLDTSLPSGRIIVNRGVFDATAGMRSSVSSTASRPASPLPGQQHFDTTLGKPIWYDGTNWVDATGTTV